MRSQAGGFSTMYGVVFKVMRPMRSAQNLRATGSNWLVGVGSGVPGTSRALETFGGHAVSLQWMLFIREKAVALAVFIIFRMFRTSRMIKAMPRKSKIMKVRDIFLIRKARLKAK